MSGDCRQPHIDGRAASSKKCQQYRPEGDSENGKTGDHHRRARGEGQRRHPIERPVNDARHDAGLLYHLVTADERRPFRRRRLDG